MPHDNDSITLRNHHRIANSLIAGLQIEAAQIRVAELGRAI